MSDFFQNYTDGPIPIYAGLNVKGMRMELSLNRKCEAEK